jgi:hypothetical protein
MRIDQPRYQCVPGQVHYFSSLNLVCRLCPRGNGRDPAVPDSDTVLLENAGAFDRDKPVGMNKKVCLHESLPLFAISGIKYSKSRHRP